MTAGARSMHAVLTVPVTFGYRNAGRGRGPVSDRRPVRETMTAS